METELRSYFSLKFYFAVSFILKLWFISVLDSISGVEEVEILGWPGMPLHDRQAKRKRVNNEFISNHECHIFYMIRSTR